MAIRTFILTIALGALAITTGCAKVADTYEGAWTADEVSALNDGFAEWQAELPPALVLRRIEGACEEDDALGEGSVKYGEVEGPVVTFWVDCAAAHGVSLERVAAHEAGHLLGLAHQPAGSPPSIMRAAAHDQTLEPTNFDRANAADIRR